MNYQKVALSSFAKQLEYVLKQYKKPSIDLNSIQNLVLVGLGGSGIAGKIASSFFAKNVNKPISCISDYNLPSYANENTLVILSSYSGNTEETLSCFSQVEAKNCKVISISSNGNLSSLSIKNNFDIYKAEEGFQPRMALGYSLGYLSLILSEFDGSTQDTKLELESAIKKLSNVDSYIDIANDIFDNYKPFVGKPIQVIADAEALWLAYRFQQQINENAKIEGFVHPMPEMCHNVIETIVPVNAKNSFFLLLQGGYNKRIKLRFEFINQVLNQTNYNYSSISYKGDSLTALLENIYILDWFSLICANKLSIVSNEIPNIINLKDFLQNK